MTTTLAGVLVASVAGSLHCAGMCGGLVAFATAGDRRLAAHATYAAGRLLAYVSLGALAGALGSALELAGAALGLQRSASVLAGVLVATWGLHSLLLAVGVRVPRVPGGAVPLRHAFSRTLGRLAPRAGWVRAGAVGLLSGFLPCGWLYAFVVAAAGTGSSLDGMLLMATFWLGTVPLLAGVGAVSQLALAPVRRHLPVVTAVLLLAIGVATIVGRAGLDVVHAEEAPACHGETHVR